MRSLNLDQLRTLTEVVTCGSFSAAARRLNLTQPAVSLQIRELEARIGVRVVERFGKQAHATEPGRRRRCPHHLHRRNPRLPLRLDGRLRAQPDVHAAAFAAAQPLLQRHRLLERRRNRRRELQRPDRRRVVHARRHDHTGRRSQR